MVIIALDNGLSPERPYVIIYTYTVLFQMRPIGTRSGWSNLDQNTRMSIYDKTEIRKGLLLCISAWYFALELTYRM